jgi:thiaminase
VKFLSAKAIASFDTRALRVNTIDFTIKGIKTGGKLFSKLFDQSYRETRACNKGSDYFIFKIHIYFVGNNQTFPHSTTRWLPCTASYADRPLTYSDTIPLSLSFSLLDHAKRKVLSQPRSSFYLIYSF